MSAEQAIATPTVIDFRISETQKHPQRMSKVRELLADSGLEMESDISHMVEALADNQLVGCAGLAGNIIKCVVVAKAFRSENLSARLLTELENLALQQGHFHLFLYTRPCNEVRFTHCGFWPLARSGSEAVLMENTPQGIRRYCRQLQALRQPGERIGAIVMNANPFTLGHRYLAEQAASACDWLHLFVVREDASFFPYNERLTMVRAGVAHLRNATVHEGSRYIISRATFPSYFLKETGKVQQAWSEIDARIFRDYIVPTLGITHRFIGSEPFCAVTRQYNQTLHGVLADKAAVVELARLETAGNAISASEARRLLKTQQFSRLREIVPDTTFSLLQKRYGAYTETA
ncbi:[citrate (pro-3S)-lyase] ligase [Kalamiella sp. sgz302252]|uniref:[citrate (pro-3S)-lyase] ligase n=1 Tax=Pantoea sp. sgz302252 TaxID=3341827 RepID=UPI0036D237F8